MSASEASGRKMGFNATWSMAVGGMVGGGIFSVLGVVISIAGRWAWLSFLLAGLIALATAYSYSQLVEKFGESGGAFTFLREIHREGFAGSLSWVLIAGYVLTVSVYAFTFGHYLEEAVGLGSWFPGACGVGAIAVLTWINLRGVGDSSLVEIVTVWGKLFILVGLAGFGLRRWAPEQLGAGVEAGGLGGALIGAASVFMAYEGFQLLTYDYEEIRDAPRTLPRASLSAVVAVILIYIAVALGAAMLVGAGTIVERKEVALSAAGREALGLAGVILVTIAAAFSTASAINATLFATARLAEDVARDGELPRLLGHENSRGVPDRAVLAIAGGAAVLAIVGSLGLLVEAASLAFLFTFATVGVLAFLERVRRRWICLAGAAGALAALVALVVRLARTAPPTLAALAAVVLLATVGRPLILRRTSDSG